MNTNRTWPIVCVLLTTLLSIGGCSTAKHISGTPITDEDVAQLVNGKTSMVDVIAIFGEPARTTPMGDEMIYTYEYRITSSSTAFIPYYTDTDAKDQADKLSVVFDKNKLVKTFNLKRGIGKKPS